MKSTSNYNKSIFIGLSMLVILSFHQPYVTKAAAQENLAEIIHLIPDNIHVAVTKDGLPLSITRQIDLIFKGNDTKINAHVTPLYLDDASLDSIPLESISIDPVMINATNQDISTITINITLDPSYPVGDYTGQLILFRTGGDFVVIPLSITIEPKALLHDPSQITFNVDPGKIPEDRIIYLTPNVDITGLSSIFFELEHTNASYPTIPSDVLGMIPTQVDLNADIPKPIKVYLKERSDYKPGEYISRMWLRDGKDTIASIPVVVKVNQLTAESASPLIIGLLILGAAASFGVSAFREGRRIKVPVVDAINSVLIAFRSAIDSNPQKYEQNKLANALHYAQQGADEWAKNKDHISAISYFQLAKAQLDSMTALTTGTVKRDPEKALIALLNRVKKENSINLGISRNERILYIPVIIITVVGFLTLITQTQIPADISEFDSYLDGIAAFLLGFASQSAATTLFGWIRSQ